MQSIDSESSSALSKVLLMNTIPGGMSTFAPTKTNLERISTEMVRLAILSITYKSCVWVNTREKQNGLMKDSLDL